MFHLLTNKKNAPAIKLMRSDVPYYGMMSKIDSHIVPISFGK